MSNVTNQQRDGEFHSGPVLDNSNSVSSGRSSGSDGTSMSPTARAMFAIALCVNVVTFPFAIFGGLYTGKFPYSREIGYLYLSSCIVPALILYANHFMWGIAENIRAWKGLPPGEVEILEAKREIIEADTERLRVQLQALQLSQHPEG